VPKRSVEEYRPVALADELGSGRRLFPDSAIEAMIGVAGEPPQGPFVISVAAEQRDEQVGGREALQHHLENAARALATSREEQRRPTARQLEKEFAGIATAARRLLNRMRVRRPQHEDVAVPIALLSGGLLPFAHKEAETSRQSANDLLRDAVRGVDRIARWADQARARQEQVARRRPTAKRNEGDKALDRFVGSVVATCWWAVYGREPADGPKLIAFVQAALRGVGEKPSEHAVRDRIRRVLLGRAR